MNPTVVNMLWLQGNMAHFDTKGIMALMAAAEVLVLV